MEIHPFVFNWNGQFERALVLEARIHEAFGRVTVINAEAAHTRPGWVDVGEDAFMAAQFRRALELFLADPGAEAMFLVQADASYDAWPEIVAAARQAFAVYRWGVFAPNVDFTHHRAAVSDVPGLKLAHAGLRVVACTDCTCWFVHRDVAQALWDQQAALHATRYGWGLDLLACALAFIARRPVLRDYSYTVRHPRGTGYNKEAAFQEMAEMCEGLSDPLKHVIHLITHPEHHEQLGRYILPAAGAPKPGAEAPAG